MLQVISEISVNGFVSGSGPTCNEDSIFSSENVLVVIDGATGLNGIHLTNEGSDAAWLSRRLRDFLKSELTNVDMTVPDILKRAAKQIKKELDEKGYYRFENAYPSAGIAVVRQNNGFLECFSLGDVPVMVSDKSGNVRYICDEALSKRDEEVIEKMKKIHEQTNCTVAEARQRVSDILLKNRLEMNQVGAYYIFEPTGAGIDHIKNDNIPLKDISEISLMTDGYYAALSCFNIIKNREEFMRFLADGKAEEILSSLKALAFHDSNLNQFPRFKIMDDASVIVARIE